MTSYGLRIYSQTHGVLQKLSGWSFFLSLCDSMLSLSYKFLFLWQIIFLSILPLLSATYSYFLQVWQALLAVRALVLPPTEDIETWIKFASLCRKNGRISQARSTLIKLLQVSNLPWVVDKSVCCLVLYLFFNRSTCETACL